MHPLLVLQSGLGGLHPVCLWLHGNITSNLWRYRLHTCLVLATSNPGVACTTHKSTALTHSHTHILLYHT